jgi:hypothetical protein
VVFGKVIFRVFVEIAHWRKVVLGFAFAKVVGIVLTADVTHFWKRRKF